MTETKITGLAHESHFNSSRRSPSGWVRWLCPPPSPSQRQPGTFTTPRALLWLAGLQWPITKTAFTPAGRKDRTRVAHFSLQGQTWKLHTSLTLASHWQELCPTTSLSTREAGNCSLLFQVVTYPAQNSIAKRGRETRYGVTGVLAVTDRVAARLCLDDPDHNAHTMMGADEAWLTGEQHF